MPPVFAAQTGAGLNALAADKKEFGARAESKTRGRLNRHPRESHLERSVAFGEQERVVGGIDNSGERSAAFLTLEVIAFKATVVDVRSRASAELQRRITARTGNELHAR